MKGQGNRSAINWDLNFRRFILLYIILYVIPFPLDLFPVSLPFAIWVNSLSGDFFEFFYSVLAFPEHPFKNDHSLIKGDVLLSYLQVPLFISISILGSIIWGIIDRRNGSQAVNYTLLILRYFLGFVMISYGLDKVIPNQMGGAPLSRLMISFGESSRMGLLWNFMELSHFQGYKIFTGIIEFLGGLLLFHSRTRLLGSLILLVAITNVVAINFFYAVPAKLYTTHLLLFTIALILPYKSRLKELLLHSLSDQLNRKGAKSYLTYFVVLLFVIFSIMKEIKLYQNSNLDSHNVTLFGVYEIEESNSKLNPFKWKYIVRENNYTSLIFTLSGDYSVYAMNVDTVSNIIAIKKVQENESGILNYKYLEDKFSLVGIYNSDSINLESTKLGEDYFRIHNRKFQWYYDINDKYINSAYLK